MALNRRVHEVVTKFFGDTRELDDSTKRAGTSAEKMGKSFSLAQAAITAFATGAVVRGAKSMIDLAARVEESENLFRVAFGDMAGAAEDWSNRVADATGIANFTLREQAATLFQMTSSMGIARDQAFELSTGMTELAQDMASFFNLPIEQAFQKLQAGITGEAEPLKRLGILVTENFIKQTDLAKAVEATGREMTEQEKVLARIQAIYSQTENAQGDLIRTQDSFTNQTRILNEQWKLFRVELGQELIPIVSQDLLPVMRDMLGISTDVLSEFRELTPETRKLVIEITALTAAVLALKAAGLPSIFAGIATAAGVSTSAVAGLGAGMALLATGAHILGEETRSSTDELTKLEDITRAVFAGGDVSGRASDLARELGIVDEHGQQTSEAMDRLREKLESMGVVMGQTADTTVANLTVAMQKAADDGFEPLGTQAGLSEAELQQWLTTGQLAGDVAGDLSDETDDAKKSAEQFTKQMASMNDIVESGSETMLESVRLTKMMDQAVADLHRTMADNSALREHNALLEEARRRAESEGIIPAGPVDEQQSAIEMASTETFRLTEAQEAYNTALSQTADFMQALGPLADTTFGRMIASILNARSAVAGLNLGIAQMREGLAAGGDFEQFFEGLTTSIAGAMQAFQAMESATEGGGAKGILGGAATGAQIGGGLAGPWGAAIGAAAGAVIGALRGLGRDAADVALEVGRDIGAEISEGLSEPILESGLNTQFFLKEIFAEGGLGVDRLAEEVGDLFSLFQQGGISQPELIEELKETLPLLIENFEELGPAGQEQIERIIAAARDMGLEFEELSDLLETRITDEVLEDMGLVGEKSMERIREAAAELGVEFDVLFEKVQGTFAPDTLEEFAKKFGLSVEEARALAEELGVPMQTNLERMAASVGLSVDEFRLLKEAASEALGKDLSNEELLELLESTGLKADELAERLGLEGINIDGPEAMKDETERAADEGERYANAIERAARAAGGITFPPFPDVPTTPAKHGFEGRVRGPRFFFIEPDVTEDVSIRAPGSGGGRGGGGSGNASGGDIININLSGPVFGLDDFEDKVAEASERGMRRNRRGMRGASRGR